MHIQNIFVSSLSATTSSIAYILLKFSDQKYVSKKKCKQLIQGSDFCRLCWLWNCWWILASSDTDNIMTWDLGYVFFQMQLVHIQNIFVSSLSATTSSIAYILLKFTNQKCVSKKKKCKQLIQGSDFCSRCWLWNCWWILVSSDTDDIMTWDLGYVLFVQMQLVHIHNIFVSSLSATTSSIAYIFAKV